MQTRFRKFSVFILFLPCSWYRCKIMYSLRALCIVILRFWKKIKLVTKFNQNRTFQKTVFWTKNVEFFQKNMDFFLRETWQQTCSRISRKSRISKKVFLTFGFFADIWFCDQTAFPLCCKNTFLANLVGVKYSSASGRLVIVPFWKKNWTQFALPWSNFWTKTPVSKFLTPMDTSWKGLAKWHNSVIDQWIVHPINGKNRSATASLKINHFGSSKCKVSFSSFLIHCWDSNSKHCCLKR